MATICSLSSRAEEQPENLSYQIGFGQNLNSYQWLAQIRLHQVSLGKLLLSVREDFNSSLLSLGGNNNKWKDDQNLALTLTLPFSPHWGLNFLADANQFSDKLSGLVSDIKTNSSRVGFFWQPIPKLKLSTELGYKHDNRLNKTDQGATYQFELKTDTLNLRDYHNQISFLTSGDRYFFRQNNDVQLSYRVKKYFQQSTYDSLSIFWTKKRRDNYDRLTAVEIFVESLQEENRGFDHFLSYGIQPDVRLKIRTFINDRRTSVSKFYEQQLVDERSKTEFHSENEVGLDIDRSFWELNCSLSYAAANQKNQVPDSVKSARFSKYFYYVSPDYHSNRLTLNTFGRVNFSASDTLSLKGAVSRFQYDTPEDNLDDRDEFRMNFQLSEIHHFNPGLMLDLSGSINLYHLVYIFSERSANNNWMRIFRLFPKVIYRPSPKLKIVQKAEVLANYVDYDFEVVNSASDIRSYVFRRFVLEHQITAALSPVVDASLNFQFEIEENGKLDRDNWSEILISNRENYWIRLGLSYRFRHQLILNPGVIIFKRIEKKQDSFSLTSAGSGYSSDLYSYGPTLIIIYQAGPKLNFSFEAMRRAVERPFQAISYINYINLKLNWYR